MRCPPILSSQHSSHSGQFPPGQTPQLHNIILTHRLYPFCSISTADESMPTALACPIQNELDLAVQFSSQPIVSEMSPPGHTSCAVTGHSPPTWGHHQVRGTRPGRPRRTLQLEYLGMEKGSRCSNVRYRQVSIILHFPPVFSQPGETPSETMLAMHYQLQPSGACQHKAAVSSKHKNKLGRCVQV